MTLKRGIALAAACWGFAALTAGAQVSWVAPLNPPTAIAADLTDTFIASAGDGTLIATGFGSDGEAVRMRIAKIAVNGTEQWVRWAGAGASSTTVATMASVARPPLLHADGSVTVSYAQGSNTCLENYAANGDRRAQYCLATTATTGLRIVRGLDDEILFAAGSAPRTIRKLSRTGTLLWSTQENLSPPTYLASSIDSAGNYVEVYGLSMIFWSPLTGQRLATATLPQSFRTTGASWNSPIVSRSGRDVVLFRDLTTPGGATNAAVGRFGSDGSLRWSINLSFAGSAAANDTVTLHSADNDGVYVVRASNVAGGNSEIVKLSASGAILAISRSAGPTAPARGTSARAFPVRRPCYITAVGKFLPGEPDRERRIALAVKVAAGGREVVFVTTHLHHQNAGFRELVTLYSTDQETKDRGGDLRFFDAQNRELPAELVSAAFKLVNIGDVSPAIKLQRGYAVLKLTGQRRALTRTLPEVAQQIRAKLFRERRQKLMDDYEQSVRKKLRIAVNDARLSQVRVDLSSAVGAPDELRPPKGTGGYHPVGQDAPQASPARPSGPVGSVGPGSPTSPARPAAPPSPSPVTTPKTP